MNRKVEPMSERKHHDMGRCWCGELHAREHVLEREYAALHARLKLVEKVLVPLANPYAWSDPINSRPDDPIDCCVQITHADVEAARNFLWDELERKETK